MDALRKLQAEWRRRDLEGLQRDWAHDVEAYVMATKMGKHAHLSELTKKFILRRRAEIRATYPQHFRVFDNIDKENNYVPL